MLANAIEKQKWKDILIVTELALIHEILLTVPSQREIQPHLREEGEHILKTSLKTSAGKPHLHPRATLTLSRTFGATLTISCVRIRDFPVELAAFFVESL